ncbi:hypothetical protein NK356_17400 [Chryseobacterium sp. S0630]|uniref:hypothetical protein n=1 Tax=Chryseobacterium sp. S0630 TaxID=2957803 RepID=UPI0020A074FE|nr:hypothetical protein [Chryseobacterium sp. S0630]MCP1300955.1 hypothetical protein [Chryseobacterium sp. S0630]
MDIALSGIVLLILILPGISFAKGFYSGEFSNQYTTSDFYNLLINTLFPSLILYLLSYPIIYLFNYDFKFDILLGLVSSNDDVIKLAIETIEKNKIAIIIYQILINTIGYLIGNGLKKYVLSESLDTSYDILKYKNIWHYIITARLLNFEKNSHILQNDTVEDVDFTHIDALVNVNDQTFIYKGVLADYQLAKDGGLDLLILTNAQRKLISDSRGSYKDIKGNYIILKYSDLINLNLTFIQLDETFDSSGNLISVVARTIQ